MKIIFNDETQEEIKFFNLAQETYDEILKFAKIKIKESAMDSDMF